MTSRQLEVWQEKEINVERARMRDEIEQLKSAVYADPKLSDPAEEFQRRLQERERQFLPGAGQQEQQRGRSRGSHSATPQPQRPPVVSNTADSPICLDIDSPPPEPSPLEDMMPEEAPPSDDDSRDNFHDPTPEPMPPLASQPQLASHPLHRTTLDTLAKRKQIASNSN